MFEPYSEPFTGSYTEANPYCNRYDDNMNLRNPQCPVPLRYTENGLAFNAAKGANRWSQPPGVGPWAYSNKDVSAAQDNTMQALALTKDITSTPAYTDLAKPYLPKGSQEDQIFGSRQYFTTGPGGTDTGLDPLIMLFLCFVVIVILLGAIAKQSSDIKLLLSLLISSRGEVTAAR